MSWIKMIDESEAEGRLAELYKRYYDPAGGVDNVLKIHSLNPASMEAHFKLYALLMKGRSELSRIQREMIAIVASTLNQCHY